MAHEEQDYVDGWRTYSDWIDDLRNSSIVIQKYDDDSSFKNKLMSCSDNQERFKLIWDNNELRSQVDKRYKDDITRFRVRRQLRPSKSSTESKRMRELGNKSFKEGKYLEALNQYTRAIIFARYPSQTELDDSLALALANRSAALYSLKRYRLCLLDINLAVKYGYPEANMFKLLIRKVKCLHVLSVWANDIEQIKDNLRNMLRSRETKETIKAEIINMFEFIEQTQPEEMEKDELDVVDETVMKLSNVSKSLSQAADCVEMSYEPEKGRYLMTNKDISFGRLLIAEEPFVCNLAPSKRHLYCYHCLGRLYSCGLGCTNCTEILYCSVECLEANSKTHSFECDRFLDFHEKIGVSYLVAHILFKINFDFTSIPIHTKKSSENKTLDEVLRIPSSDWPDLVYKNDYASVLSLMDHSSDYEYDEMMGYVLTATYLMIAFIDHYSSSVSSLVDSQAQYTIGSIVLRHLLQLQTNIISVLEQNLQGMVSVGHNLSDMQERPIGVGIYPTVSLLNHSCQPNIISILHKNKFITRAASALECGTEINYCYGPSFTRLSKKDRQKRLKNQYFFSCQCDCCINNKENESRALVCPKCNGPVIYNQDLSHQCMKCHSTDVINVSDTLEQFEALQSKLSDLHLVEDDDCRKLKSLEQIETNLSKLVFWRNPIFVRIKSQLIECAENQENLQSALKYCEQELDLSDKTYGSDSLESILTKLKLINLRWQHLYNQIEESKTNQARESSIQELKTLLSTTNATRGKLKDLLASTSILGAESTFENELKFLSDIHTNINRYLASFQDDEDQTTSTK